jgi:hypothetical protein
MKNRKIFYRRGRRERQLLKKRESKFLRVAEVREAAEKEFTMS